MKHGKFVKIWTWNGTMTSQLLPSRLGKLVLVLFNNANSNDYHWRFVMKVEVDGHWNVKAEQNLTLTLTKPLNSNVNSLIWVSIFVVSWLTWIFCAENRWKLVLTFKHIFKGCSSIWVSTGEIEFRIVLSLTGSGFQTLSRSPLPKYWLSIPLPAPPPSSQLVNKK